MQPPSPLAASRQQAWILHQAGHFQQALQLQIEVVNTAVHRGEVQAQDYHRLGVILFVLRQFEGAASAFAKVLQLDPAYPHVDQNWGLSLIRAGRVTEAIPPLQRANQAYPHNVDILAGLTDAYSKLADLTTARHYGEHLLLLKDQAVCDSIKDLPALRIRPNLPLVLDPPEQNIIAYSLFGKDPMYLEGALTNTVIAKGLYPGWRCRFYCDDSVPEETRLGLQQAGAQVVMMPRLGRLADGLFWRFCVAEDPTVTRFLVRDCDSLLTIRERRAVDEWLASDSLFHVMRDHPSHVDLILAGLWGGVAGVLPPLSQLLEGFSYNPITQARHADQLFLGQRVWPLIKNHCLTHDSVYTVLGSQKFPQGSELPLGRHVGDTDAAFQKR